VYVRVHSWGYGSLTQCRDSGDDYGVYGASVAEEGPDCGDSADGVSNSGVSCTLDPYFGARAG
jgi:hypothetical protein